MRRIMQSTTGVDQLWGLCCKAWKPLLPCAHMFPLYFCFHLPTVELVLKAAGATMNVSGQVAHCAMPWHGLCWSHPACMYVSVQPLILSVLEVAVCMGLMPCSRSVRCCTQVRCAVPASQGLKGGDVQSLHQTAADFVWRLEVPALGSVAQL